MHPFPFHNFLPFNRKKKLSNLSQFNINFHLNYFYFIWKNVYLAMQT